LVNFFALTVLTLDSVVAMVSQLMQSAGGTII
jgi:hypothetical protein